MSRKGDCWDNSVAESFFGSLEIERVFDSVYRSREEARGDIVDYIEIFFNSKRRHSYLGYLSPNKNVRFYWITSQMNGLRMRTTSFLMSL